MARTIHNPVVEGNAVPGPRLVRNTARRSTGGKAVKRNSGEYRVVPLVGVQAKVGANQPCLPMFAGG
jgi:hypothetical protein